MSTTTTERIPSRRLALAERVIALLARFEPEMPIPTSELDEWTATIGCEVVEATIITLGERGALSLGR